MTGHGDPSARAPHPNTPYGDRGTAGHAHPASRSEPTGRAEGELPAGRPPLPGPARSRRTFQVARPSSHGRTKSRPPWGTPLRPHRYPVRATLSRGPLCREEEPAGPAAAAPHPRGSASSSCPGRSRRSLTSPFAAAETAAPGRRRAAGARCSPREFSARRGRCPAALPRRCPARRRRRRRQRRPCSPPAARPPPPRRAPAGDSSPRDGRGPGRAPLPRARGAERGGPARRHLAAVNPSGNGPCPGASRCPAPRLPRLSGCWNGRHHACFERRTQWGLRRFSQKTSRVRWSRSLGPLPSPRAVGQQLKAVADKVIKP